jgi:transcriptional regulator with XRE-family HTH domain
MIQVQSIEEPFRKPEIAGPTFGVLRRADAMGLLTKAIGKLDFPAFREVVQSIRKAGIARGTEPAVQFFTIGNVPNDLDSGELLRFIKVLTDALEESPAPLHEWQRLTSLFKPEQEELAELLGVSLSSLRRYSSKERETPDTVATRLHFLALLTGDLAGAYNDMGVRSWFRRKRALLDGRAPKDLLQGDWRPGDPGPERVRALARSLAAGSST